MVSRDQGNEGSREIELLRNMAKVYTIGFGLNQSQVVC